MSGRKYVSYRRVSTDKQGKSGLGLGAQEAAVQLYISQTGGVLLRDFLEVESGKNNDRPQLQSAISYANRSGATLIVAKLDRLSRNVAFLATLMETKVKFVAADNPHATSFTVHIMAAVAEWEREAISKRTRDAMQSGKANGAKYGSARRDHWKGREERRTAGAIVGGSSAALVHKRNADQAYRDVAPLILERRSAGDSLSEIARSLNAELIPTRRGKLWTPTTVRLVISRFSLAAVTGVSD